MGGGGWFYQFKALYFGLSTAPQVFTRVFAAVSAWAHSRGICPRFLGGRGQKERPGSALALSLPQYSDKGGEVTSCSLADCKLPRYDHQCRGCQDFSCPGTGREISVGGGEISCFVRSPCSALAGALGAPGFAGEVGSLLSSSNALPAVTFEDALVPRVRSSLASGASVPGGERGSVLVDGAGPSSAGSSIRDTSSGSSPVFGRVSVGVGHTPPQSFHVWDVVVGGEVVAHQPFRDEGIAIISGDGHWSSGDCDVRQLDGCGLRQQAGQYGVPFPLLIGQLPS